MHAVTSSLNEAFPATAASVPAARHAVTDFAAAVADLAPDQLDGVRLAVSEAVTNVVLHAYPGDHGGVEVRAGLAEDNLWVLVADTGCGHQTPSARPGLGCGLAAIASVCDSFTIGERIEGGTEVRMGFLLA